MRVAGFCDEASQLRKGGRIGAGCRDETVLVLLFREEGTAGSVDEPMSRSFERIIRYMLGWELHCVFLIHST